MSGKKHFRPHSNASRLWVAAGSLWPPFANQMVIEGSGSIEYSDLANAVEKASMANHGARLVLSGFPGRKKWTDSGNTPAVRTVDGTGWSGYDMHGAPFLLDRLDIKKGPSCEVLLVTGRPGRIILRTHHAVMDGRGTITWAEDIFRALNGKQCIGSEYTTTESDLLNLVTAAEKPVSERYISPSGRPGTGYGFTWFRKKLNGRFTNLLPSVMMLTAEEAWRHGQGKVRIAVPVDLRSRRQNLRSTGNLTNAIFFNINSDTTLNGLETGIKRRIREQVDGILTWEDHVIKFIPVSVLKAALSMETRQSHKTGLYRTSATISNLGIIPHELFKTDTFNPESVFFIPPGNSLSPFFITLQGSSSGLDIVLTIPSCFNKDGIIDGFFNRLISGIESNNGAD